ncbi:helix-turn-helix domain-containing protein [Paenibacillus sp. NPDC056579]|uniref:helix-turn-helix domain-containing protein n=1 Tax=Paenibacillus sp. NPDC056579 TaxID=3345871 RepID=UPI0036C99D52
MWFTLDYLFSKQCRPGWSFQRRLMKRHALLFVTGGQLELCVDGEWHRLESGQYALLAPGELAEARVSSSEPSDIVLLSFSYGEARPDKKGNVLEEPNALLFDNHLLRGLPFGQAVLPLIEQLEITGLERGAMGHWKQTIVFQQLLFTLATEAQKRKQAQGGMREAIQQLVSYLDEYYMNADLSLQSLAESYGISWSNFSGIFKKYVGVKPIDYLTQLRMNHAKSRLLQSVRMEEVAQQVGYRDPLYFSRTFKKNVGITPSEYRKISAKENIITLSPHVNDYLLALDMQPFATLPYAGNDHTEGLLPYIADKLRGTRLIGEEFQHDPDTLVSANPRMILSFDGLWTSLASLQNIAPTVNIKLKDDWRSLLFELSAMFGRKAQYVQWIRHFEQKASLARRRLAQGWKRNETVMVLIASSNELRVYGGRRQLGEVLYRELRLLPPQGITLQDHYTCVTPEQLRRFEPDHIFLATTNSNLTGAQVKELRESDAWNRLSAVRRGNVYEVSSWLNGHAPIQHSLSIDIAVSHLLKGASQ